ncbi:unnamed protein product [Amoebophrya sp. A120]|nr:unnamed protein product [Amoebophrya sp. A120]|eukprot:GSA120T00025670001.1
MVLSARTSTFSAGAAGASTSTAVVVTRHFCSSWLLLFLFFGAQKMLPFGARATVRDERRSSQSADVDVRPGGETTTSSNEEEEEQKLPRIGHERTTTGAPAAADDSFDDDVVRRGAGEQKRRNKPARGASSYKTPLQPEENALFDVVLEGSAPTTSRRATANQAAAPASGGRAALEVGAAGTGAAIPPPRTTEVVDLLLEQGPVEQDEDQAEDVASEQPEHEQQEVNKPEQHQDRPLEKHLRDHLVHVVKNNDPHHCPNLRGGRTSTSDSSLATSSSSRAAAAASSFSTTTVVQVEEVVQEQVDEENKPSWFLNSTGSSPISSAEDENKSGESESLTSSTSDFVQKTAGRSVVRTTSDEFQKKEGEEKQQHQEKEQQRTRVQVGDLLGCACSAGEPAFSLSEDFLDRRFAWARLEPICKPPAFCPVFGRPYYVPWNAPLSLVDQLGKSPRYLKANKRLVGSTRHNLVELRYQHDQETEPPGRRTGGRSPGGAETATISSPPGNKAATLLGRCAGAGRSRLFSNLLYSYSRPRRGAVI